MGGSSIPSKAQKSKSSTWKKRAREQILGTTGPSTHVHLRKGKRALPVMGDSALIEDVEPCMKKARNVGGVVIHESESVVSIEQPRWSQ